ncbi:HupE/UreJ family protein [Paenibacillus kandeliae]|uniref:HupE/UreJ family protein n=1 Tax=Paenibacillus kandeliae TaxID=3231269 RepID=UPI0034586F87
MSNLPFPLKMNMVLLCVFVLLQRTAEAHGFGGSGFLHPLTGIDHLVAMLAVGVWSAQIGGKAIWIVPSCFVLMMMTGGLLGLQTTIPLPIEWLIACSVVLLGAAIWWNRRLSLWIAGCGVAFFGFSHGYAHGLEIPSLVHPTIYIIGFLTTTIGLHVVGATGGLLILEERNGQKILKWLGRMIGCIGICLILR